MVRVYSSGLGPRGHPGDQAGHGTGGQQAPGAEGEAQVKERPQDAVEHRLAGEIVERVTDSGCYWIDR